jgi:hypothetical protein
VLELRSSGSRIDQVDPDVPPEALDEYLRWAAEIVGVHADAAWEAAELVDSHQLRAWVPGTQSSILRFAQRHPEALERAQDGPRHATGGTRRARLLAGVARCHANLGDAPAARLALAQAQTAFDERRGVDETGGMFTFSRAKLLYYSGVLAI